ncbi:hypothetical protein J8I29_06730 [Labrys sp. LIt4]|uniref:hypothetical protein n=1 Tax=Labrys sp. LIt4 TaxID=2821355 RepID=UPI001ADFC7E1|nr:hypothetical protein [Labrys sp. LIt4]MBP0578993.1 hypothetical protein [Labrys sp. LIt4]
METTETTLTGLPGGELFCEGFCMLKTAPHFIEPTGEDHRYQLWLLDHANDNSERTRHL